MRSKEPASMTHTTRITHLNQHAISRDTNATESTARCWLRQRQNIVSLAYRTTPKKSAKLELFQLMEPGCKVDNKILALLQYKKNRSLPWTQR